MARLEVLKADKSSIIYRSITMKCCPTCGNDIADSAWRCQFCEATTHSFPAAKKKTSEIHTVNLERGLPLVDEALERLERELRQAKASGTKLLRLVHGYGSTGTGGKIKDRLNKRLPQLLHQNKIKNYVEGELYSDRTNAGSDLLSRYSKLRSSLRSDSENPGITFVEL